MNNTTQSMVIHVVFQYVHLYSLFDICLYPQVAFVSNFVLIRIYL